MLNKSVIDTDMLAYRENIVIKRAENVYPTTSDDGNTVGVVASYVHGKVALDTTPEHIEVSTLTTWRILNSFMWYFGACTV